jgi:hypothetical protein
LIWQHGAHHKEVLMEAKTSGKADAWRQHIKTQLARISAMPVSQMERLLPDRWVAIP